MSAGLNDITNSVLGEMTVRVTAGGQAIEFDRFLDYSYKESWLEASSSFDFTLDQKELSATDLSVLVPGAVVQPLVDGNVQARMILDAVEGTFSRDEGSIAHCSCRDWLSVAVDSQVDPQVRFVPSMTLLDLITTAYSTINPNITIVADAIALRNVVTGRASGESPTSVDTIAQHILGSEKPQVNEGLFTFTSRVAQRFGLWIHPYTDGETIVVSKPDFTQKPAYGICHAYDGRKLQNNVERGTFARDRKDQPSIIYASGFGGGGNFAKSRLRAGIVNVAVNADNSKILNAYSDVPLVKIDPLTAAFPPITESAARPAFLYDAESHTQEQLEAFLKRELSLRMRKALTARYDLMGHLLNNQPIAVDTIASVLDQQPNANWNGPMWVVGREFRKSPKGGARSTIDLVLPFSVQF